MTKHTTAEKQAFLERLDKKPWHAADRLRSNLDAAVHKHAIFHFSDGEDESLRSGY